MKQALAAAAAGELRPVIGQTFPLAEADRAHQAIENRSVFGSTLLVLTRRASSEPVTTTPRRAGTQRGLSLRHWAEEISGTASLTPLRSIGDASPG